MFDYQHRLTLEDIAARVLISGLTGRDLLIQIYLPYCLCIEERAGSKRFAILNREYRPLGTYDFSGDRPNLRKPNSFDLHPTLISQEEMQWFDGEGFEKRLAFSNGHHFYGGHDFPPGRSLDPDFVAEYRSRLDLLSAFIGHQPVGLWASDRCPLLI